jgi:uncharacterized membrane protein YcaP (DUF421 family)
MQGPFELSMPWWDFVWRGIGVYLIVLLLLRLAGKRSFGDLSPFDIVVLMVVGGSLRTAIIGKDASFIGPLISVTSIIAVNKAIGWTTARWKIFDRMVEGLPAILATDGKRDEPALRHFDISNSEFERELRSHGLETEGDIAIARLEANGKITLIRK